MICLIVALSVISVNTKISFFFSDFIIIIRLLFAGLTYFETYRRAREETERSTAVVPRAARVVPPGSPSACALLFPLGVRVAF